LYKYQLLTTNQSLQNTSRRYRVLDGQKQYGQFGHMAGKNKTIFINALVKLCFIAIS
jgi:hypothetical protein